MSTSSVAVYIDGFNLYHGMHSKFGRRFHWLDLHALATSFLKPEQQLVRVAYFTARVRNDPAGQAHQGTYLAALRALSQVEIVEGRFQEKAVACHGCGRTRRAYEEKESDVSLATALVEDAARQTFDRAILVSADSDLSPAVRASRRLHPDAVVIAAFPPERNSAELRKHVHGVFNIGRDKLARAQMPDSVLDPGNGTPHVRPAYWAGLPTP